MFDSQSGKARARVAALALTCCGMFAALALVAGFRSGPIAERPQHPVDPATSCGPVSLGLVGRWLGETRSIDDLTRFTHSDDTGSTSLLELQVAANSMGLAAIGVRFDPSSRLPCRLPMILHLPNHFAAIIPLDGDSVILADPPRPPSVVRLAELGEKWDGMALVVARSQAELDEALGRFGLGSTAEGR